MSLFYSIPDVYDMAADIGREFESLIDSHGAEHVTALMQKVGNQLTNQFVSSLTGANIIAFNLKSSGKRFSTSTYSQANRVQCIFRY